MSNIEKWWMHVSIYNKIKATLAGVLILVEAQLLRSDAHWLWHSVAFVIGLILLIITNWFQDNDGDGKVDIFQKKL